MQPERLARSGLLGLLGSAASAGAAFIVAVVVGNALGPSGTGLFFQAVGLFTIVSQVLRLGTNSSLVRAVSEHRAFDRRGGIWRTVLLAVVPVVVVSTLTAIAMHLAAAPLAGWLASEGTEQELEANIRLMSPFVVAGAVLAVLQIASRLVNGIRSFTLWQMVLMPAARLAAVGAALVWSGTVSTAFGAWLAVLPAWVVITCSLLARPLAGDWRDRALDRQPLAQAARGFWAFGGARAVGGALEIMLDWADVLIVAALTDPTAAGVYAVVTRIVRAGQIVDRAMRLAVSPTISRLLALGERESARELHTRVTRAMVLCGWPFYLTLVIMGPAVLAVFGPGFESGAPALAVLGCAMMLATSTGMLQSVLLQGGRSSWQVYDKSAVLAASIGLNLLVVPVLGFPGAALTWAAVTVLDVSIAAWQVHRLMGVRLEPLRVLPSAAVAVVVFGGGMLATRLVGGTSFTALLVGLPATCLAYAGVLWLLRARLHIEALWREVPVIGRFAVRTSTREQHVPH